MTRVVRAASTTSAVTKVSSLMLRIRWIWTNSRWMSESCQTGERIKRILR